MFVELDHPPAPDIRLWLVHLDRYATETELCGFQPDEVERAARFRFDRDRTRYLAARHALRRVLGAALSIPGDALGIGVGPSGKPQLDHPPGKMHFNLSHSDHSCLIGTSAERPIGVDVELVRPVADAQALAHAHFTPREYRQWITLPDSQRDRGFLQCWTRKEACLKAVGLGLSVEPREVDVGIGLQACNAVVRLPAGNEPIAVHALQFTDPGLQVAAVATASASFHLRHPNPDR